MNRGEIWTASGGTYSSKPRPVVVLQDDAFDATESVTVVPLTSVDIGQAVFRVSVTATAMTGIERDSWAMVDKVTTVRRSHLGARAGRLPTGVMLDVERATLVFLGIAR
jgi:mRNA interferase MazF